MQAAPASSARIIPINPEPRPVAAARTAKLATGCSACNLRALCLPCGLEGQDVARADEMVYARRRIRRGEYLYRAGDVFSSIYAVRSGFLKGTVILEDGREQVTGFHMAGEIVGLDGIGGDRHGSNAVALEDGEICVIPYARLQEMGREMAPLARELDRAMSREIVREHGVMLLLASMRAEERLATFLLNLSRRFAARGYSGTEFHLRMTRDEIGSYLGLKLETVSRAFSKLQEDGLLAVRQKHLRLLGLEALRRAAIARL